MCRPLRSARQHSPRDVAAVVVKLGAMLTVAKLMGGSGAKNAFNYALCKCTRCNAEFVFVEQKRPDANVNSTTAVTEELRQRIVRLASDAVLTEETRQGVEENLAYHKDQTLDNARFQTEWDTQHFEWKPVE